MSRHVTAEWWFRWTEFERARQTRQAWAHQARAGDSMNELSSEERELIAASIKEARKTE